jgi:thiol-disulfide isomerase/thioredoxin
MTKIFRLVFFIFLFCSNSIFGQVNDSIKDALVEEMKNRYLLKDTIYNFIGKELPKFSLTSLKGDKLNSDYLRGKPTLINFWFSNCSPCIEEMPVLNEIKSHFGNDVNFISITYEDSNEVTEFLKRREFNFTHLTDSRDYLKSFGFFGYPKTLILDKNLIIIEIEKLIPKDISKRKQNEAEFKQRVISKLTKLK